MKHRRNPNRSTHAETSYFRPNQTIVPSDAMQQLIADAQAPQHGWMYIQMEQAPNMTQRDSPSQNFDAVSPNVEMFNQDLQMKEQSSSRDYDKMQMRFNQDSSKHKSMLRTDSPFGKKNFN